MGEKVKKCPKCTFINDEYAIFCTNPECKESLMNVTAVSAESLQKNEPEVRGTGDPVTATETATNNESAPGNVKNSKTVRLSHSPSAQLECLSQPGFTFKVIDQGIIGRQGNIDVSCLDKCISISRKHAQFIYKEGKWYLQHLSKTNETMVNNFRVPERKLEILSDGDRITLANTSFLFKAMKP